MIARKFVDFVGRHARLFVAFSLGIFLLSLLVLPAIRMGGHFEINGGPDNPAMAAQSRLSAKFGIEGSPNVLLIAGDQEEVLRRAEELTAGLEAYRQRGVLKSIFSPTNMLPSARTQKQRASSLAGLDLAASARALEDSLRENGIRTEPFRPFIERLRDMGRGADPITLEKSAQFCRPGCSTTAFARQRMVTTSQLSPFMPRIPMRPR